MKISEQDLPYLLGQKYSNNLNIDFVFDAEDFIYQTRFQILEALCQNKKVIHIGFVDHTAQSIEKKIAKDKWLHARLRRVSERCYGLDINRQGVDYVRDTLGYNDIECLDILSHDSEEVLSQHWNYLLIPDVLEHQNNPVEFLERFAERFKGISDRMVITVPNAFAKENFNVAKRNIEAINTDHRFWFTPYTLAKVITSAGLALEDIRTCRSGIIKPWTKFKNYYFSRRPLLRNNIVATIDLRLAVFR